MAEPATSLPPAPTTLTPSSFSLGPPTQPSFDAIELLPERAQDALRKLRQRCADAHALVPLFEEQSEATNAKLDAERQLKKLTDHQQNFGFGLKPDDPRVVMAQRHLDKMTADLQRFTARNETRTRAWREAGYVLHNVETWLRDGKPHGVVLQVHDGPEPKLLKGEGILDGIEHRRRRVRELRADLARIAAAPFPSSHAREKIRSEVEQLAQRGEPVVSGVVEHDGSVIWPSMRLQAKVYNGATPSLAFAEVPDVLGLFAFVHKQALLAALDALVDAESDDPASLSDEARQKAEAEVLSDILANDRDESWFVWQAIAQSLPVEHRSDCSPLAILQCKLVAAPAVNGSGTSWMHAINFVGGRR